MQFTDKTLTILKNFAAINPSVILKKGKVLRTISQQKTIMAVAELEEEIPRDAGIYDVARFLSALSLYGNPEIEFGENSFTMIDGKRKMTYVYTDPSVIFAPPERELKIPSPDVTIDVSWSDLQMTIKAAGIFQLPEIAFVGDGSKVYMRAIDSANPTTDDVGVELGDTEDTFRLVIKVENLKLIAGDYHVQLSSKGISSFETDGLKYMVAVDATKSNYTRG